jgi:hypothetical protein
LPPRERAERVTFISTVMLRRRAKAGIQYAGTARLHHKRLWNTGSAAFASMTVEWTKALRLALMIPASRAGQNGNATESSPLSSSAKAGIQYAVTARLDHKRLWNTGSSAFADDDIV